MFEFDYPLLPLPFLVWGLLPSYIRKRSVPEDPVLRSRGTCRGPRTGARGHRHPPQLSAMDPRTARLDVTRRGHRPPPVGRATHREDRAGPGSHAHRGSLGLHGHPGHVRPRRESRPAPRRGEARLDDFIARRVGDRIGIVVIGSQAFVQTPFTQDKGDTCGTRHGIADGAALDGPESPVPERLRTICHTDSLRACAYVSQRGEVIGLRETRTH